MRTQLAHNLEISRIVHGHWRITEWNLSIQDLLKLTEQAIELGITSFDHADIYGNYTCEQLFGNVLSLKKNLRNNIQLITKCGIKLLSDKYPNRELKHYDYSYSHIVDSVERSLQNFQTDYIDLLLLHRPAPYFNPEEVSKAFEHLKKSGKVLNFGVSNFNPMQFEMLNKYLDDKLVTNQVEISPYCLEHFENSNMDFFLKEKIKPMAWSPLAGGEIINPKTEKGLRVFEALKAVSKELEIESIDQIAYAWLLNHPANIIPIVGSGKIERIENATKAQDIKLSLEQWYKIYNASTGSDLP